MSSLIDLSGIAILDHHCHTLLRPGFFSQNLGAIDRKDIAEEGRMFLPAGRGRVAFVEIRDVAIPVQRHASIDGPDEAQVSVIAQQRDPPRVSKLVEVPGHGRLVDLVGQYRLAAEEEITHQRIAVFEQRFQLLLSGFQIRAFGSPFGFEPEREGGPHRGAGHHDHAFEGREHLAAGHLDLDLAETAEPTAHDMPAAEHPAVETSHETGPVAPEVPAH